MKPRALMHILYVRDCNRALAFWCDVMGLEVVEAWEGWARLRCGDAYLALHGLSAGMKETVTQFAGLNLEVDDLTRAIDVAVAGGAELIELHEAEPRVPIRLAILREPDGNVFELRQHA